MNYFILPFFLLCLFNLLIILNTCKRTKRMSNQLINSNEKRKSSLNNEYSPIIQTKQSNQLFNRINFNLIQENSSFEIKEKKQIILKDFRITRDRKAARSLFILVFVFLIFLFPYVICAIATTAAFQISSQIFQISFWLLWINSTFNPFIYPFIQNKYRRAYQKLFKSCFKSFYLTK